MTRSDITARGQRRRAARVPLVLSVTPREDVAVGRVDQMADAITTSDRYPRRPDNVHSCPGDGTHRTSPNTSGAAISDPHHRRSPRAPGPGLTSNSCVTKN
jgi:hypothetical protein